MDWESIPGGTKERLILFSYHDMVNSQIRGGKKNVGGKKGRMGGVVGTMALTKTGGRTLRRLDIIARLLQKTVGESSLGNRRRSKRGEGSGGEGGEKKKRFQSNGIEEKMSRAGRNEKKWFSKNESPVGLGNSRKKSGESSQRLKVKEGW